MFKALLIALSITLLTGCIQYRAVEVRGGYCENIKSQLVFYPTCKDLSNTTTSIKHYFFTLRREYINRCENTPQELINLCIPYIEGIYRKEDIIYGWSGFNNKQWPIP
jgi:hypothetical protein